MRIVLYRRKYYAVEQRNGAIHRRSLRTSDLEAAKRNLEDLKRHDAVQGDGLVGQIVDTYLLERGDQGMRWAWKRSGPHFAHLRPDQITEAICRQYTERRQREKRSNGTIIKEIGVPRTALKWAKKLHLAQFEFPPTPPPRERHLSRDEFRRLLEGASVTPHVELFVRLALATGARAGALLSLTWLRVDLDRRIIRLAGLEPESRKRRATVPINDSLHAALLKAREGATSSWVIEASEDQEQPLKTIRTGFEGAVRRAKLGDDVTPNVLRHTAAVWMAEAGVSMDEIAQYLGHTETATTERHYARFSPTFLRRAASALEV